ncbi:hypothetical protein EDC94DRAFT_498481, partial [Helicostylum pulchrum]
CTNLKCLKSQTITEDVQKFNNYRLWNRDLAAVLNFRNIVFSLRATSQKPASFSRSQ